eukprot:364452-Chlamydomonas_euryale.AAC.4
MVCKRTLQWTVKGGCVPYIHFAHFLARCNTWAWTEVQMGRLKISHSDCLRRIAGVKLTDSCRLGDKRDYTTWHVLAGVGGP